MFTRLQLFTTFFITPFTSAFIVVVHLGNTASLTPMTILRVDPSKLTWTIPCFPVMKVDFKRVSLLFKEQEVEGLIRFDSVLTHHLPLNITCLSSCDIEVEDKVYLVVWEFTHSNDPEDVAEGEHSDKEDEPQMDDLSDEEDPDQVNHCLPFKVMGVTYNTEYQEHLEAAKAAGITNVRANIKSEPENEYDSNAIAVFINYGFDWVKIGYIAKELTRFIHPLMGNGKIVSVDVKHIKFSLVYLRVGYYITINITRKGQWEEQVARASQKVK